MVLKEQVVLEGERLRRWLMYLSLLLVFLSMVYQLVTQMPISINTSIDRDGNSESSPCHTTDKKHKLSLYFTHNHQQQDYYWQIMEDTHRSQTNQKQTDKLLKMDKELLRNNARRAARNNTKNAARKQSNLHSRLTDFVHRQQTFLRSLGREFFNCSICMNLFVWPTTLPLCGHTFCLPCLDTMAQHSSGSKCPICRTAIDQHEPSVNHLFFNLYFLFMQSSLSEREEYEVMQQSRLYYQEMEKQAWGFEVQGGAMVDIRVRNQWWSGQVQMIQTPEGQQVAFVCVQELGESFRFERNSNFARYGTYSSIRN